MVFLVFPHFYGRIAKKQVSKKNMKIGGRDFCIFNSCGRLAIAQPLKNTDRNGRGGADLSHPDTQGRTLQGV